RGLASRRTRRSALKAMGAAALGAIGVGRSARAASDSKVTICHKPGTAAEQTMEVPASALGGHLGHGDFVGVCCKDKTCVASDQSHTAGTCARATGQCSNPTKPDDTPCYDGNACTRTDTCQAGACRGGNPVVCTASDLCHTAGVCNPATGICSNPV